MDKQGVVPDVINVIPSEVLQVTYPKGKVDMGNVLTPAQVKEKPKVSWNGDAQNWYTLCMTDPDAPSRKDPKFREWHHWLVVNIPDGDLTKGETLSEYIGSEPPRGTGLHRYVFVLFKQNEKIAFNEKVLDTSGKGRANFSVKKFAKKYNLGDPVAGNFFQAEYVDTSPKR